MKAGVAETFQGYPRLDPYLTDKDINVDASAELCATAIKRILFNIRRARLYSAKYGPLVNKLSPENKAMVEAAIDKIDVAEEAAYILLLQLTTTTITTTTAAINKYGVGN